MNRVFAGRWAPLPVGYNIPKRVLHHAPALWGRLVRRREMVFVHFMGAKPWMASPEERRGADWEAERPAYRALEAVWWKVRRGELAGEGGSLLGALPPGSS